MSRINVANFRHPDATADSITVTSDGDTQINRALGLGGATYGSSGQVLTSAGSGSTPTWTTPTSLSNAEDGAGTDFEFNSGYGSNATAYGVRAWWRGSIDNPPTTSASANISSMTYGGNSDNTLAFTNAMPDANYATVGTCWSGVFVNVDSQSTGSAQIRARDYNGSYSGGPAGIIVVR